MLRALRAALAATLVAVPALAQDGVHVSDAYARLSPHAGAVFLVIENHSDRDDRLMSATTDVAAMTGLHTHVEDANGVMQMREIEGGLPVPAGATVALARGGDHVMLMDLTRDLADGDRFTLTLTFESGAVVPVEVVVDNARRASAHGMHGAHGAASP